MLKNDIKFDYLIMLCSNEQINTLCKRVNEEDYIIYFSQIFFKKSELAQAFFGDALYNNILDQVKG